MPVFLTNFQKKMQSNLTDSLICPLTQEIMEDPVCTVDGQTYEREAIQKWFAEGKRTSPATMLPLNSTLLVPNIRLKALIQDLREKNMLPKPEGETPMDLESTTKFVLKKHPSQPFTYRILADGENAGINYVLCLDVSGSMHGEAARKKREDDVTYSRSAIMNHAVSLFIQKLRPQDALVIIAFSTDAKVIIDFPRMTPENKKKAIDKVNNQEVNGGTNYLKALDLIYGRTSRITNSHTAAIFFTDGQPDHKGIVNFHDTVKTHATRRPDVSLYTVGFGYEVDRHILGGMATAGNGRFIMIADQTMTITSLIFLSLNLQFTCAFNVKAMSNDGMAIPLGTDIRRGIPFDFIAHGEITKLLASNDKEIPCELVDNEDFTSPLPLNFPAFLHDLTSLCNMHRFDEASKALQDYSKTLPVDHILQKDFYSTTENTGQIGKAIVERVEYKPVYEDWGALYLAMYTSGATTQTATNNKDNGLLEYQSEEFKKAVEETNEMFLKMPLPKAMVKAIDEANSYRTRTRGPGCQLFSYSGQTFQLACSSACFSFDSTIEADGFKIYACAVFPGMKLKGGAIVEMIVTSDPAPTYKIGEDLWVTAYHPYAKANAPSDWKFPINDNMGVKEANNRVFNFVLSHQDRMVGTDGTIAVTFGHGIQDNKVTAHPFFANKEMVLASLQKFPGFDEGRVHVNGVVRDNNGLICDFK